LIEIKGEAEKAKGEGKGGLEEEKIKEYERRYEQVLKEGYEENPYCEDLVREKRRKRRSKAQNLLERMRDRNRYWHSCMISEFPLITTWQRGI